MTDTSKREELIERPWTQDHYVTRNSISEDDTYRVWMTCRCGWNSGDLPDGNLPTTHQAELEHYVAVFEQAHTPTDDERHWSDAAASAYPGDEHENYDLRTAFGRGVKWERSRTVQGEPTDAMVLEALNARELSVRTRSGSAKHFTPALDLSYYSEGNVTDMRAALRAAAGIGQEEKR